MRVNLTITVGSAPINIVTGTTAAPDPNTPPKYAGRLFIQMLAGGSGIGYVLDGIRPIGRVPAISADDDVTAQLAAASAGAPGGSYGDTDPGGPADPGGIDLRQIWVHGANSGDKIKVTWAERI